MSMHASGPSIKKRVLVSLSIAALLSVAVFLAGGCGASDIEGKVKVAATIEPLADFCRQLGGEYVEVETLVASGASPHTYEPTADQLKFLSEADVFVTNGLGLDSWAAEIVEKVENPELVTVAAGENVPKADLIEVGEHGDEEPGHEAEEGVYNPHVWLDPNLAVFQVEAIRDRLVYVDPEHEQQYLNNAEAYLEELGKLDESARDEVSGFTEKEYVAFHPSFTYFAKRYGLDEVGVIELQPGREPSSGEIGDLIRKIEESGVKVVFTEPQFNPKPAEAIASETGARVVEVDPLGDPGDPETGTYLKLIEYDIDQMSVAMK